MKKIHIFTVMRKQYDFITGDEFEEKIRTYDSWLSAKACIDQLITNNYKWISGDIAVYENSDFQDVYCIEEDYVYSSELDDVIYTD